MNASEGDKFPLTIVAAVARNGVIGGGNQLLWCLSSDLKQFKAVTMGKPLIMGRKTFESIGKPLPGRETIVVTRDTGFAAPGVHAACSVGRALEIAGQCAAKMGADEIIVAGGGDIYAATISLADRLLITWVDLEPLGDTSFPAIDEQIWRETSRQPGVRGEKDEAAFTFAVYERIGNTSPAR